MRRKALRGTAVAAILLIAASVGDARRPAPAPAAAAVRPTATAAPTPPVVVPRPVTTLMTNPLAGGKAAWARAVLVVYNRPSGRRLLSLSRVTPIGGPRVLLVSALRPGWVQVRLPVRPNTATGWVRASDVIVTDDPWSIEVSRARHTLTVRRHGVVTARYPVAVGKPSTPTPAGLFFVTDRILTGDPAGAYGPAALGLSGYSDVLTKFGIGDGVLGIHGTEEQSTIGRSVSHGCVRMRNADSLVLLRTVWLGTAVVIS